MSRIVSNSNVYKGLVSLFVSISFLAPLAVSAQSLSGYTFCLDPGHGPGNINAGPTGLHEHIINMRASRALSDLLYSVNSDTVILTRDESTTTDPTLSQREQIANSNNVDWFHAVHHNATGWPENPTVRYTLVLYSQNGDQTPLNPGSETMSPLISQRLFQGLRTSEFRTFGDFNFYGSPNYLGVLDDLTMPSELSEATFHDHPGEEAKLYNPDFTRMEGRGIFYGILDYFTGIHYTDGVISGIVTDSDTNEPLDSVRVQLNPGDSVHYTDDHHSGYYAFHHLAPGQYTVTIEKEGYVALTDTMQVHPGLYDFADFSTGSTAPPTILSINPADSSIGVSIWTNLTIEFSRPMDLESVENALILAAPGDTLSFMSSWNVTEEMLTLNPLGAMQTDTWYTLTLEPGATDVFGHALAGHTISFQTQTGTTQLIPVNIIPSEQQQMVDRYSTISVRFSRSLDPEADYANKILVMSDNFHRVAGRVDLDDSSLEPNKTLTLVPDTPLDANRAYTVTVLGTVADTTGQSLGSHFTWTFRTSDRIYQATRLDSGQSLDQWTIDFEANTTVFPDLVDTAAIHDFSAIHLYLGLINFDYDGSGGLRWTGPTIDLAPGDALGFYAKGASPIVYDLDGNILEIMSNDGGWQYYSYASESPVTIGGIGFEVSRFYGSADGYLDEVMRFTDITGISAEPATQPENFNLIAYPNPFNPSVTLILPNFQASEKWLSLYSLRGELLMKIPIASGENLIRLNLQNLLPNTASGVYLVRLQAGSQAYNTKILYLK